MGREREVEEYVATDLLTQQTRKRTTTHLEWVCQFVSTRIAEIIFRGLKTTRTAVIVYGSANTNNVIYSAGELDTYTGVDEVVPLQVPTLEALDIVNGLRAVSDRDLVAPGDPLAALVDAVQLASLPAKGGLRTSQKDSWTRTIYLVTDAKAEFSYDGAESVVTKMNEDKMRLCLLALDFGPPLTKIEAAPTVQQTNEAFWRGMVSQIHGSTFRSAADAIAESLLPTLPATKPAPMKTLLCFGDPNDLGTRQALQIPIALYKRTDIARPLTRSKISKLAHENGKASQQQEDIIYTAKIERENFLMTQLAATQYNNKEPEPLPAESHFTKAWKLGASLIPVPDEHFAHFQSRKSMEILHFVKADSYRLDYSLEQIWYVFADNAQIKAQIQLASFAEAMIQTESLAVVRMVRRDGGEPEIGVLKPCSAEEQNWHFYYSKVPFREDLHRFLFPPLDRVITTEGVELRQGPSIPTEMDLAAMDEFVDSMELQPDWFSVTDSYNPAIHGLKAAIRHRFSRPDDPLLPAPHPSLAKYLEAPYEVRAKAAKTAAKCRERFRIAYVPPKSNVDRKRRNFAASHDDAKVALASKQSRAETSTQVAAAPTDDASGSETEDEQDSSIAAPTEEPPATQQPPAIAPSLDLSRPVEHLMDLVEKDDVTQAVIQLEATIRELVQNRSYDLTVDCLRAGKKVAQEYEEAMRWNLFIRSLKRTLIKEHKQFWQSSVKGHYELGLVTEQEDEAGQSDLTHTHASDFIETDEV